MSIEIVNWRELTLEIVILWSVKEGVKGNFYQVLQLKSSSNCAQFVNIRWFALKERLTTIKL